MIIRQLIPGRDHPIGSYRIPGQSDDFRLSESCRIRLSETDSILHFPTISDSRIRQLPTLGTNNFRPQGTRRIHPFPTVESCRIHYFPIAERNLTPKKSVIKRDKLPIFPLCANHNTKIDFYLEWFKNLKLSGYTIGVYIEKVRNSISTFQRQILTRYVDYRSKLPQKISGPHIVPVLRYRCHYSQTVRYSCDGS